MWEGASNLANTPPIANWSAATKRKIERLPIYVPSWSRPSKAVLLTRRKRKFWRNLKLSWDPMGSYKLRLEAKADFRRIYRLGVVTLVERRLISISMLFYQKQNVPFSPLAENLYQYQQVEHIREGYRRSPCGSASIYYCIDGDTVEIMNIIGRQDAKSGWKTNNYSIKYK